MLLNDELNTLNYYYSPPVDGIVNLNNDYTAGSPGNNYTYLNHSAPGGTLILQSQGTIANSKIYPGPSDIQYAGGTLAPTTFTARWT